MVRMLAALLLPDVGRALVCGADRSGTGALQFQHLVP